ncbi:MAG: DNA topoisomerase I [Candidatus Diapherotrites archaeon]|nr:DNA topoisomerase I [Candidatus Diapherotrites archaeon]
MRLIIAEKAIAAKRIAEILGAPKAMKEGSVITYEIDSARVVPLRGHILNVDYPPQYNNWRSTNLHQLSEAPVHYSSSAHDIVKALKSLAPDVDRVTIATDFDTEGESIGREAITVIQKVRKEVRVDRAKFSAITPEDIKEAFKEKNLTELDYNLADAADTRREIDLIWGAVLTRYMSLTSGRLGDQFLSVGRVQTPTLALIVDREKERRAFQSKKFWVVSALFHKEQDFEGVHREEKFWEIPQEVYDRLKSAKHGTVTDVKKTQKELSPPTPFNTTEFLRAASGIGVSPKKAMSLAEELYQAGFISYPRTDNTVYPETIKVKEIVKKFTAHEDFGKDAEKILAQKKITPTKGKKQTKDHPPIYPAGLASKKSLSSDLWKVYELVVRRFFATLAQKCLMNLVRVDIDVEGEPFVARGQTIVEAGWKEFYPYSKSKEVQLPELHKNDEVSVKEVSMDEKETQPPKQYAPASLIKQMEDFGLGTKSTRPEIISKLQNRHYIIGTKSYEPTELAFPVIEALEKFAPDITKPTMTSKLEKEMSEVEQGKKDKDSVVKDSREMLGEILRELGSGQQKISETLRGASKDVSIAGKCQKCGKSLRMIVSKKTKKRFVGCEGYPKCDVSFPLPQKGGLTFTNKTCEKCGTPIVKVVNKGRRPYEMCLDMKCETKANWGKKKVEK